MEKQEDLHKTVSGPAQEIGLVARIFINTKKYFLIGGLAGIGLLFNGCFPGYISSEPSYTQTTRPSSPSSMHVWVDGNWVWSRNTQNYTYRDGYWKKPHNNRKYRAGHWNSSPKGHKWSKGHWENQ